MKITPSLLNEYKKLYENFIFIGFYEIKKAFHAIC